MDSCSFCHSKANSSFDSSFHNVASHYHKMRLLNCIWHSQSCSERYSATMRMLKVLQSTHFVVFGHPLGQKKWDWLSTLNNQISAMHCKQKFDLIHNGPLCWTIAKRPLPTMSLHNLRPEATACNSVLLGTILFRKVKYSRVQQLKWLSNSPIHVASKAAKAKVKEYLGRKVCKGALFNATKEIGYLFHFTFRLVQLFTKKRGFLPKIKKCHCH